MHYGPSLFGQDGWILAKYCFFFFFLRVYGSRESRGLQKREKRTRPILTILTEEAWSIKDLLYGQKVTPNISFKKELDDDGSNSTDKFLKIL